MSADHLNVGLGVDPRACPPRGTPRLPTGRRARSRCGSDTRPVGVASDGGGCSYGARARAAAIRGARAGRRRARDSERGGGTTQRKSAFVLAHEAAPDRAVRSAQRDRSAPATPTTTPSRSGGSTPSRSCSRCAGDARARPRVRLLRRRSSPILPEPVRPRHRGGAIRVAPRSCNSRATRIGSRARARRAAAPLRAASRGRKRRGRRSPSPRRPFGGSCADATFADEQRAGAAGEVHERPPRRPPRAPRAASASPLPLAARAAAQSTWAPSARLLGGSRACVGGAAGCSFGDDRGIGAAAVTPCGRRRALSEATARRGGRRRYVGRRVRRRRAAAHAAARSRRRGPHADARRRGRRAPSSGISRPCSCAPTAARPSRRRLRPAATVGDASARVVAPRDASEWFGDAGRAAEAGVADVGPSASAGTLGERGEGDARLRRRRRASTAEVGDGDAVGRSRARRTSRRTRASPDAGSGWAAAPDAWRTRRTAR